MVRHVPAATRGEGRNPAPFWGLLAFTFILFVAPQTFFPVLSSLRIALVTAGLALLVYVAERMTDGRPLSVTPPAGRRLLCFSALSAASIPFARWPGGAYDMFTGEFIKALLIFLLVANTVDSLRRMKVLVGSMILWCVLMSWTAVRNFSTGNFGRESRIHGFDS